MRLLPSAEGGGGGEWSGLGMRLLPSTEEGGGGWSGLGMRLLPSTEEGGCGQVWE